MESKTPALAVVLLVSIMTNFAPYGLDNSQRHGVRLLEVDSSPELTVPPLRGSANLSPTTIRIGDTTIEVEFAPGHLELPTAKVINWVSAAAHAVADYY